MLTYIPTRQAPAKPSRKAGKVRSFRAACVEAGYSFAFTQAALNAAGKRAIARKPIAWPNAS